MIIGQEIDRVARSMPRGAPPVAVGHSLVGKIGECVPGRGLVIDQNYARFWRAFSKDAAKLTEPRPPTPKDIQRLLDTYGRGHVNFQDDVFQAITTWDGVLNARANGKAEDFMGTKASQTTVAAAWSSFYRSTGVPAAGSYTAIPNGAVHTNVSPVAGAWPLTTPTGGDKKYLINVGMNHVTGTNIVMLIDLLVAAGSISTTTTSPQTVNSVALDRYTSGDGVMMAFEVTSALGATASNLTVSYTGNKLGGGQTTGAIAMTTSCIVYRLQPSSAATTAMMVLAAGDSGVVSVQTCTFSASMTGTGVVALNLYKPLVVMPTIAASYWIERTTPGMLGGIMELPIGTGGNIGCLTFYVLTSTTSTGVQLYQLQTCAG